MLLNGLRRCYKDISNTGVTPKSIMMNEGSYMLYSFIYMEFYTRKMHIRTQSTPSLVWGKGKNIKGHKEDLEVMEMSES